MPGYLRLFPNLDAKRASMEFYTASGVLYNIVGHPVSLPSVTAWLLPHVFAQFLVPVPHL
jgi:hypothetical protein